jgi:hypothetical protein
MVTLPNIGINTEPFIELAELSMTKDCKRTCTAIEVA